jgi:hypothetical protein
MPSNHRMQRRVLLLSGVVLLAAVCGAQNPQPASEKDAQEKVMALMRQQIGLDGGKANAKNPSGLKIQFSRIAEVAQPDGTHQKQYRLLIPGAPQDQEYTLAGWRIGAGIKYSNQHVFVNAKGLIMLHKPTAEQENLVALGATDEVEVGLKAARGEPVRYMMASADGKLLYSGTIVPYPIESRNAGCHLEVRLGFPEGQTMLLYADGLAPTVQVPFKTTSEGEEHISTLNTDAEGRAVAILSPYVAGKDAGTVKMSVAIKECSVAVEIPWGKGSYHPL